MDHSAEAPHIRRSVHAAWRSTATTSNSSFLDSARLPAINLVQCKQFARPSPRGCPGWARESTSHQVEKEVLAFLLTSTSSHGGPPSPVHMEVQCRVHLQFTWRSSAGSISSSHGVQCRAHLQFTWRSSAGSISTISSSHGGPVQGPSPQSGTAQTGLLPARAPSSRYQA